MKVFGPKRKEWRRMKTSKSVKTSVVAVCAAMMLMNPVCASAAELADETAPEA